MRIFGRNHSLKIASPPHGPGALWMAQTVAPEQVKASPVFRYPSRT